MSEHIEAHIDLGGSTVKLEFVADHADVTMHPSGRTVIRLAAGRQLGDDAGPASWVIARRAYLVIKRPMEGGTA